jgi:hypothetical protein
MSPEAIKFEQAKFKEMIMYFADCSQSDQFFGAVKLNKLLFLSDFISFGMTGKSISGETYIHQDLGPVPSKLVECRKALINDGDAELKTVIKFSNYKQERLKPKRRAKMKLFTKEEIRIMEKACDILKDFTGTQASDLTHLWSGWRLTKGGEEIPYYTYFVRQLDKTTLEDINWGKSLISQEA